MQYLIRWLVVSGGAALLARTASGPLRRSPDARIVRNGFLVLLASWLLTIADAFLPVHTAPPLGIVAFLFCTLVSIAAAIAAGVLAVAVLARRTGRVPAPTASTRIAAVVPLLLIAAAVLSFFGERVLSIVAAVNN